MLELNPENKVAGALVPVFALRGAHDLGVGDTEALREMIIWAAEQGLEVLQILPVNAMGGDNSPYNLLSAMALEPITIAAHPGALPDLSPEDFSRITARHDLESLRQDDVKYEEVKVLKNELLAAAFETFQSRPASDSRVAARDAFLVRHADWLPDYARYRALVSWHGEDEINSHWPVEHRSPAALARWSGQLTGAKKKRWEGLVAFHSWVQWIAYSQWLALREFAENAGVALMGDVPVGVSLFSADVWAQPEIFDTDHSSGAPPEKFFAADPFTEKWGQNWGFPLYDWNAMAKNDFAWWRRRLRLMMEVFHLLRVDHALGFFRIYSFPWRPEENERFLALSPEEAADATGGELPHFRDFDDDSEAHRAHNQKQGEQLFRFMLEETGPQRLVAEDLGELAPYVRPTLEALEIPGFKIPQWEHVDGRLRAGDDYPRLSLAAYATHDHPPLKTLWDELFAAAHDQDQGRRDGAIHQMWELMDFCGQPEHPLPQPFSSEIHEILLHGLFASNSWLSIPLVTDLFGTTERFNVPGSASGKNWTQRMPQPVASWGERWKTSLAMLRRVMAETGRGRI